MADCFSMPNAAELVEILRQCADDKNCNCKECKFVITENNLCMNIMINCAADAIEQLVTKCDQLEAERDAAVADMQRMVDTDLCEICGVDCNHVAFPDDYCTCWKWRGVQNE